MTTTDEAVRRTARVLTGFMSPTEANGFAASFVIDPPPFIAAWKAQIAGCSTLSGYRAPRIDQPPASASTHIEGIRRNPIFAAAYGSGAEVMMIELGKLVAFQHWVDADVSDGVHGAGVDGKPDLERILQTCLPPDIIQPAKTLWQGNQRSIAVYSTNNTLDISSPDINQATGQVTFSLFSGTNLMLVREHKGRYILANGYHRALLLRSRGVEMVPAVLARVVNQADAVPGQGFIAPELVFADRPPTVDDFLDDSLSVSVPIRAMLKAVRISVETSFVPRLI